MLLLILDSLGSTELFFILLMALVFFGPRKLPQLSRSLGKNLAEFRKASEDFKRTWEREVAFEESTLDARRTESRPSEDNSILNQENLIPNAAPTIEAVPNSESVARETSLNDEHSVESAEPAETSGELIRSEPSRKQDWL